MLVRVRNKVHYTWWKNLKVKYTVEKFGRKCKLKNLVSKGSVFVLKTMNTTSKPCVIGRQKKVHFVEIDNPPKRGKLGSASSCVHIPFSSSSVGGSRIHGSPITSIGRRSKKK